MALLPAYYERLRRERHWTVHYERTQERATNRTLSDSDAAAMTSSMTTCRYRRSRYYKRRPKKRDDTFGRILAQDRLKSLPVLPVKRPNEPRQLIGNLGTDPEMAPPVYEREPGELANLIRSVASSMRWRCKNAVFEASRDYPRNGIDEAREVEHELWIKVMESGLSTETHTTPYLIVSLRNRLEDAIRVGYGRQKLKEQIFRYPNKAQRKPQRRPQSLYDRDYAAMVDAEPVRVFYREPEKKLVTTF